jgi:cytoskeletal protein RodZ
MNQKLPRPLRDALARQAGGEVHPSPDVLTSFMERTLPLDERELVTDHLALCPDCREVVFLASNATEDVVVDESKLAAAHQPAVLAETRRRRWTLGLSWVAGAAAVLLVAGVLVRQRFSSGDLARQPVSSVASNSQPPRVAQPQPAASGTPSAPETLARTTRATTTPGKASAVVVGGTLARKSGQDHPSEARAAAATTDESAQTPVSAEGGPVVAVPVPGTHNAFVQSQSDTASQFGEGGALAKPMMSMRAVNAARGQWRISADGHLEHRGLGDDWTRVLADEATTFRVVSVVGGEVWAGGDGGALFRSDDAGQQWNRVPLVSSSSRESGTIVSIQFKDSQHGTVLTDGGSRWTTSDGGVIWTTW